MQNKKNIFILFLLIPFIWVVSAISYAVTIDTNTTAKNTIFSKENSSNATFQSTPLSTKKTDNLIDETEPEFEIEFDSFYAEFGLNSTYVFLKTAKKSFYTSSNVDLKHKVPLYDLFCNWKIHII